MKDTDEFRSALNELIQNNIQQAVFTPVDINNECIGYSQIEIVNRFVIK